MCLRLAVMVKGGDFKAFLFTAILVVALVAAIFLLDDDH
jgi:hypothetical protein